MATIAAGEFMTATGWWVTDRDHGLQFKATHLSATQPTTLEGIEKYLLHSAAGVMLGKK